MAKTFKAPVSQDFVIMEDGEVVGNVRIKPNQILWSPKGEHSWYGLTLKDFGDHAKANGRKQKK